MTVYPSQPIDPPATIRVASRTELPAINRVIEQAVNTWPLPERLKALTLPLLRYDAIDAGDYEFVIASCGSAVTGVAAWDRSVVYAAGTGAHSVLLHGLYVAAAFQHRGIGRTLQDAVFERATAAGAAGVVVKAERVAAAYFERCGYQKINSSVYGFSYPYSYWRPLAGKTRLTADTTVPEREKRSA